MKKLIAKLAEEFSTTVLLVIVVAVGASIALVKGQDNSFGLALTNSWEACSTTTSAIKDVGGSTSNGAAVVLAANPDRAWARIQGTATSTLVTYLSFDEGSAAVRGAGVAIAGGVTTTTTPKTITFGTNTEFPYAGAVTAIVDAAASSTVIVTECEY